MAKYIRRAGIVFFALVISCLLAIGSLLAINVNENTSNPLNANANNVISNNVDTENGLYNNMEKAEVPTIPTADSEFVLTCTCPAGEPCSCGKMAEIWTNAVNYSEYYNVVVKVTLGKDWIASNADNHIFGTGNGFYHGAIDTPVNASIILDLNGKTIDRKLETEDRYGYVLCLSGTLTLIDSKYDSNLAKNITTEEQLDSLPFGRVTGGMCSTSAGGVSVNGNTNAQFNIYGGMICLNTGNNAGGISGGTNSVINIYDGLVAMNDGEAGGIYVSCGTINIYAGYIMFNQGNSGAGIGCYGNRSTTGLVGYLNLYGGTIAYNKAKRYGGGITTHDNAIFKMYSGEIIHNSATNDSGGLLLGERSIFEMYGGKISNNIVERTQVNTNNGGGGVMIVSNSTMTLYDGEISYNKVISNDGRPVAGGGILLTGNGGLNLKGGIIKNNSVNLEGNALGGGVCARDSGVLLTIGGGVQIFDNTSNGKASDVYLVKNGKIGIDGLLGDFYQVAHIGIDLATDYGDVSFTHGYNNSRNRSVAPSRYFFANADNKVMDKNTADLEVMIKDGTKITDKVVWTWTGAVNGSSTSTNASVVYSGESFSISCYLNGTKVDFYRQSMSTANKDYNYVDGVGNYAFCTNVSCANPVFTLNVEQKEVDILWENDIFVYNGGIQTPSAYIAEDATCKVTIVGGQINSGSGFMASAIELSNKNYKINPLTMNKLFSISKAKLNRPTGSGNFEYDGSQKEFTPNGYNFVTMNIVGNTATNTGDYTATISIKDKHNYEWEDGGTEDIVLPYSITLTPPIDQYNGVYKFMYIDTEDGKEIRKTYAQGGIVHGINDMTLNGGVLVLGGISPNTSIKTFLDTLGFDKTKVTLRDNKGNDVFKNNAPIDASNYDNGKEYAVGTGWRVVYNNNGNTEEIYLSVLGDINGDGRISASDVATLREIANNKAVYENLSVEIKLASMVINKGNVTTADAEIVKNVIDRLFEINIFF